MARPLARALTAATVAAILAASCSRPAAPPAPAPVEPPNLVLITLGAARADHVGCYGAAFAATPTIDRLAAEGALAESAFAVAPLTRPAQAAAATGLLPRRTGVRDDSDVMAAGVPTLAEHMKARGYATAASVGSQLVGTASGLLRGFDLVAEPRAEARTGSGDGREVRVARPAERRATDVVNNALDALARVKDGPFFLWVQVADPVLPYTPPNVLKMRFADQPYDGEIAGADVELSRLVDQLRAYGIADRTVIALTSSHGEGLGDHGEAAHGVLLYDATLRVPFVVRYPARIPAGTRFAGLVSGVDVAPTLLDLLGAPPLPGIDGTSVAGGLADGAVADAREAVYAESLHGARAFGWSPVYALRTSAEKFIEAPEPELYDLAADPRETRSLAPAGLAARREQLRAAAGDLTVGRRDPKRLVAAANLVAEAETRIEAGDPTGAERALTRALGVDPANIAAMGLLGSLRYARGEREGGLAQLRAAAAAAPEAFEHRWNLANALFLDARLDEAEAAYRAALELRPRSGEAHYALGNVLARGGDPVAAIDEYNRALEAGAVAAPVRAAMGAALVERGDLAGAEAALRAAVDSDPSLADAWNKLGILMDRSGRRADALGCFDRVIELQADHADALFNRGRIELLEKDLAGARRDVDALRRARPDYAAGLFLEANLLVAEANPAAARSALTRFLALPGADPRMVASARGLLASLGG